MSIANSDYSNYQIVVVDNDSTDKSMEYFLNWADGSYNAVCDDTNPLNKLRNKNIQNLYLMNIIKMGIFQGIIQIKRVVVITAIPIRFFLSKAEKT